MKSELNLALMWAASVGDSILFITLYSQGASVQVADKKNGRTVLHWAAMYGRTHIIRFLLTTSVSLNEKDRFGKTALDYAKENQYWKVVPVLQEAGATE